MARLWAVEHREAWWGWQSMWNLATTPWTEAFMRRRRHRVGAFWGVAASGRQCCHSEATQGDRSARHALVFFLALHCALSEACARCVAPCTGGKAERALSMAAAEQVRTERIERIPLPRTQQAHTTQQGSHDVAAVRCGGSHSSLTAPRGSDPLRRLQRALRTLPFPPFEHAATRAFVEPADGIFFLMLKIPWHSCQPCSTRCGDGASTRDGGECSSCSVLS